jgi:cytosine/adenosine deaminase-related metal-dependent hydrolase
LVGGFGLVDAEGDLVGDPDTVAFEGDYFFGVIGEDADVLEAEVDQDLRADAAFVLDHALARGFTIELAALVKMNLREHARFFGCVDAETAASVMEVQEDAAVFLGDGGE